MATPTSWVTKGPKALPVLASLDNLARLQAREFDKNYPQFQFPSSSHINGAYAMPGLIVAVNTATGKFVPWVSDASHGAGSDTAVGILIEMLELATWDRACTPMYHGEVVEAYCYTEESALGVISAGIKSDLPDIKFK